MVSRDRFRGADVRWRAFTLIELLVVISVIAVLMAILMPSLQKARRMGQAVVCRSHLKQWGQIFHLYAFDNENKLPQSIQGDALRSAASPMPLGRSGARVASQHGPILRHGGSTLSFGGGPVRLGPGTPQGPLINAPGAWATWFLGGPAWARIAMLGLAGVGWFAASIRQPSPSFATCPCWFAGGQEAHPDPPRPRRTPLHARLQSARNDVVKHVRSCRHLAAHGEAT